MCNCCIIIIFIRDIIIMVLIVQLETHFNLIYYEIIFQLFIIFIYFVCDVYLNI